MAPGLAVVGVVAASLGVSDPGSRVAVPFLSVMGLIVTVGLAKLQRDREEGSFLQSMMLASAGVRLLVFAAIHQSIGPYLFAPDQYPFEQLGEAMLSSWTTGGPLPERLTGTLQVGFPFLNAVAFLLFGPARAAVPILNLFLGCWLAIPIYHMTRLAVQGSRPVAEIAVLLVLFFPSLVLWSVLNIREAPAILLSMLAAYFLISYQHRLRIWDVAAALVALGVLALFREYLSALVGVAGGAGVLMGKSRSPLRSFVVGVGIMLVLALLVRDTGFGGRLTEEPSLSRLEVLRQDMALGAGSAYGQEYDVSTLRGAVTFLPVGIAYFLLAPFPWSLGSTLQTVTIPETTLWYILIPFVLRGIWLAVKHEPGRFTVIGATLVVVSFAYALVEGNVGTAYRHRAQVLPLMFVFCAVGLRDYWAVWMTKRARAQEAVRRARQRGRDAHPPFDPRGVR